MFQDALPLCVKTLFQELLEFSYVQVIILQSVDVIPYTQLEEDCQKGSKASVNFVA